jgi:hypothetical protein
MTGNPFEWTAEERQRAKAVLQGDARKLNSGGKCNDRTVTPSLCEQWRNHIQNGGLPTSVDSQGFERHTVRTHVTGGCKHDDTGKPVAFEDGEWVAVEEPSGVYSATRLGWRYECRGCGRRDLWLREEWLWCRECGERVGQVLDLQAGKLVEFEDIA